MGLFIQRAPVVYAFDTKELAEEKKVSMEKWLQASTEADDAESYWWPMAYPDILCGKTLWLVTMVGFRGKDVPKRAKERERWLKKKVKELENPTTPKPPKVAAKKPAPKKVSKKKEVKKHVATTKARRRK